MFTLRDIVSLKNNLKSNVGNKIVITIRGGKEKVIKEYKIEEINNNFVLLTSGDNNCRIRECFSYNNLIIKEFYIVKG
ncbi:Veg family protein [Clostridium sp.]|uniref:Veg family protein n=1 Tax=Clostridium sp. TaxID=1506 RepID=UPI003F2FA01F